MIQHRIKIILALLLLALLTAVVLEQAIPLYAEPDRDNGIYLYLGKQIVEGKLPYVDAWEQKPPLIFYVNATGLALANGSRWGVFALEFIAIFTAGCLFFWLANTLWDFETAALASVIWLLGLESILQGGNFTEEYSLPFNILSLALFWLAEQKKKPVYYFGIGLCFALTFFLRPNNAGTQIAIGLSLIAAWALYGKTASPVRKLAWMAAGALLPTLIIAAYFSSLGILREMIEVGFLYNFSYGSQFDLTGSLTAGAARLAPLWWLAVIGYLAWASRLRGMDRSQLSAWEIAPLVMLPLEIFLSGLSGRNYAHYFICWLPALAFFSGHAIHHALPSASPDKTGRHALAVLLLALFLFLSNPKAAPAYGQAFERLAFDRSNGVDKITPLADYIRNNTAPSDTVLVWSSWPGLNFMTDRDAPTAYFGYPMYVNPKFIARYQEIFLHDLTTAPPELIIDGSPHEPEYIPSLNAEMRKSQLGRDREKNLLFYPEGLDEFFQFFEAHYQYEIEIDGYIVYRLTH